MMIPDFMYSLQSKPTIPLKSKCPRAKCKSCQAAVKNVAEIKEKEIENAKPVAANVKSVKDDVACSYRLSWTKFYMIFAVWINYCFEVYVSYIRQFSFISTFSSVPDELKPFYTDADFEEAKIQFMFRTLIDLENKYNSAVHLTVMYLTNVFCTLWWMAGKITSNRISRAIVFNVLHGICHYRPGDLLRHVGLILSSYSLNQGACRACNWMRDVLLKSFSYVSSFSFVEELFISVLLTLMTTPMCVILFFFYRLYKAFILPRLIEESPGLLNQLEDGELKDMINTLCQKFSCNVTSIYVSYYSQEHSQDAKIRGVGSNTYLVLGRRLVNGYQRNEPKGLFSMGEIAAAVLRAQAEYNTVIPTEEFTLEATRWATTVIFSVILMFGFCGGSRLGFIPAPPQAIAYMMSKHLALPVFLMVQILSNCLRRKRHFSLDEKVAEVGFGDYLISYIGKEARSNMRFPIEDPIYTAVYSERPPALTRIQNLNYKMKQFEKKTK